MSWITPFGFQEVSNDFNAFGSNLSRYLESALIKWFNFHVIPAARRNSPVLTGNLKSSINIVHISRGPNTISFIVGWGSRAEYGKFVERGTKFMEARQFMRRAIIEKSPQLGAVWVKQISVTEVDKYHQKGLKDFRFTP